MSRRSCWLFALLPVCLILCGAPLANAQNTFAAIHGTVTDTSGAVIPDARVVALNTGTNTSVQTKTDDKGYYLFPQLAASTFLNGAAASTYTITINATGFQQFEAKGIVLNLNDNRDVDAAMKVGSSATTVEVQTSAVQVQTSDTQLSTEVDASEIEDMPLLGRDVVQLQKTAPGVAEMSDRFGTFSTDGSQTPQNSFLLDGIDINDGPLQTPGVTPSPDALAEVNFISSTLNPEFSRNSGMTVNETFKSGTNTFHGDGFEFYRDTFLTNGNYFSPTRPVFHQNLFGGTLGGPILKDKFFAFVSYQGLRNVAAQTTDTPVFGATTQLAGNFTTDYNESTGALNSAGLSSNPVPFAFGSCTAGEAWNSCFAPGSSVVIPQSQWNSISARLTSNFVPAANFSVGGAPYYNFNALNTAGDDQGIIRLDYHLRAADTLWFSTLFESNPTYATLPFIGADVPGFPEDNALHTKIFNASYTHTFTPNVLNELKVGYYRFVFASVEPAPGPGNVSPASYGFDINPQDTKAVGLPAVSLGDFFTLGFSEDGPQPRNDQNYTANDNFTWVKGAHNLKFGAHIEKFFVDNPFYFLNNGAFAMDGGGPYSSGDPAIDFELGIPDTYEQTSGGIIDAHAWELYGYGQDDWKVSSSLTLNFGLAWDSETPNANEQWGGLGISCWQNSSTTTTKFTPVTGTALPPGMLFPGDPGCSAYGGTHTRWANFGPRIGAAWSPESGPKFLVGENGRHDFSIRAGFGVYYNRDQEEESLQNLLDPPFAIESEGATDYGLQPSFASPYTDVAGGGSGPNKFPFTPATAGSAVNFENYFPDNLSNVTSGYRPPYTYNYNLNIQRQLTPTSVLQVGYVGSVAHDLPRELEGDPITSAGQAACAADPTCVSHRAVQHLYYSAHAAQPALIPGTPVPWYLSIGNQVSDGSSNYNSLQVEVTKAVSHGLTFRLAYTYAHALDDASGYESSSGAKGVTTNFVPGYQYLNYGDSDYDFRHRLVGTYNYGIPIVASWRGNYAAREALAGWHFTGITGLQGGFPITFSESGVFNSLYCDAYSYYGCPDVPQVSTFDIKKMDPRSASHQYFDTSVFSPEPIGTFGNAKRNFFHGPGYNYSDMTLYKDFPLRKESQYVEIRMEAYNAFNHANFAPPSGNLSAGPGVFGYVNNVDQNGTSDPLPGRAVQLVGKVYF